MADLELQTLQRSVHLAEYARSAGYEPRARDSTPGVTVLEHPQTHDRVAVARTQSGQWIFASLPDDKPSRPGDEPADRTRERLRDCIARARDKGSVVEFVRHCERVGGHRESTVDQVREHLRAWQEVERAVAPAARALLNKGSLHERTDKPAPTGKEAAVDGVPHGAGPLNRRIGDWTPLPASPTPNETEVQERLRRWQEAQRAIDLKLARASELASPRPVLSNSIASHGVDTTFSTADVSRNPSGALTLDPAKRALGQRRYDWTPPVGEGATPLARTLRDRGPDRGR